MSANTKIEWATDTFNPWWGCTRVSAGCEHCYAESSAKRYGHAIWGTGAERRMLSDNHWRQPLKWNKQAAESGEPRRVFCGSMCDVFEENDKVRGSRLRLFDLIEATPALTWMLLTKRPENMTRFAPDSWRDGWPRNVWAMCTVEDQKRADERLPYLARVPAVVRGVSMEPLLGPVEFDWCEECHNHGRGRHGCGEPDHPYDHERECGPSRMFPPINHVIVGGESGPKARPMHPDWTRGIRDQCQAARVPFFFKQWGEYCHSEQMTQQTWSDVDAAVNLAGIRAETYRVGKKPAGRELDGRTWDEFPKIVR